MRLALTILMAAVLAACTTPSARPIPPTPPPIAATPAPTRTAPAAQLTHTPQPTVTTTATVTPAPSPTPTSTPGVPTDTVVERGQLVPGFSLTTYARVPAPSSLTFGPDGRLYVASTNSVVYALADRDGDHVAEETTVYATGVVVPLGLAWLGQTLYISYQGSVAAVDDTNGDGVSDRRREVLSGLPSFGLHQNDGLALGPDGYFYLGMGSPCDHCRPRDPRSAGILRFRPDGSDLSVYARGLRNPYDLAFNARGDLFATDNGRDDLGPTAPPEELNLIRAGGDYGWPDCWTGNLTALCAGQADPVATFSAHTSADGLAFYHGTQFPPEYFDNAFVAILGSIYMFPQDTERGLQRVRLARQGDGYTAQSEWFLKLPDGRPVDLTVGPDGGLYVADYAEGAVYRIVWGR